MPKKKITVLKIVLLLTWCILLTLLVRREVFIPKLDPENMRVIQQAKEEQYYGIWYQQKRIGYALERYRPTKKDTIALTQEAYLLMKILNTEQPVQMVLTGELTQGMHIKHFDFKFNSPFYSMRARGKAENNTISFQLDTGQNTIKETINLDGKPLLPINRRAYLLTQQQKIGDKIKVPFFDPLSLAARDAIIEYLGQEKVFISNRVHNLHHFKERHSGVTTEFWLNDSGKTIKEKSPAGFTFLAEPQFKATAIDLGHNQDILATAAVIYQGTLPSPESETATYRLSLPKDESFDLGGGRQTMSNNILTIHREDLTQLPSESTCREAEHLKASRYVQSDSQEIVTLAQELTTDLPDPLEKAKRIGEWVYQEIEKRPVIGLPDALATLNTRKGDCNEHAALFAALARAANIPTTIATGVTLHKDAFYYHAWNEICVGNTWVTIDTTTNQVPTDIYHIRFARGDLLEQLKIGSLIGNLGITIVEENKQTVQEP